MTARVIRRTEVEVRAELDGIYHEHPELRDYYRECCSGCATSVLGDWYGWGNPIVDAWGRVEELRFLLGEDA